MAKEVSKTENFCMQPDNIPIMWWVVQNSFPLGTVVCACSLGFCLTSWYSIALTDLSICPPKLLVLPQMNEKASSQLWPESGMSSPVLAAGCWVGHRSPCCQKTLMRKHPPALDTCLRVPEGTHPCLGLRGKPWCCTEFPSFRQLCGGVACWPRSMMESFIPI